MFNKLQWGLASDVALAVFVGFLSLSHAWKHAFSGDWVLGIAQAINTVWLAGMMYRIGKRVERADIAKHIPALQWIAGCGARCGATIAGSGESTNERAAAMRKAGWVIVPGDDGFEVLCAKCAKKEGIGQC
jgi:hypothetical protein